MVSCVARRAQAHRCPYGDHKILRHSLLTKSALSRLSRACAIGALAACAVIMVVRSVFAARAARKYARLDDELNERAVRAPSSGTTSVILRVNGELPPELRKFARPGHLRLIDAYVLDVPNSELKAIGSNPS